MKDFLFERVEDARDWINEPYEQARDKAAAITSSTGDPAEAQTVLRTGRIHTLVRRIAVLGATTVLGVALLFLLGMLLNAVWRMTTGLLTGAHSVGTGTAHGIGDLAPIVGGPLASFVDTHATGLSVPAAEILLAWLVITVVLWIAASCGSRGGQLGWVLTGLAAAAAVWCGDTEVHRPISTALVVLAWAVLSIPALRRVHA
ncbi:hypothetical protein GCM10010174_80850 [Kutzneria viridogrisea]|uniref:Yip1 domain-containing protein n=1 Tax=Kutzneria viridogrisea TaxID=47990 RepID=A0ABR6BZ15_9PSEU|nr:hypothetical protein [Kutzneria viridogrisea]